MWLSFNGNIVGLVLKIISEFEEYV